MPETKIGLHEWQQFRFGLHGHRAGRSPKLQTSQFYPGTDRRKPVPTSALSARVAANDLSISRPVYAAPSLRSE